MTTRVMIKSAAPYLGMVLAQFAQVGLIIVSKKAMSSGMTNFTFIFYSNALASLILLPSSFIFHRRSTRPPLTFSLLCGFFLLGVLGCAAQITGYAGINYTSASFASALLNLNPAFTFVLAVIFRMEKVDFSTSSTIAKIVGTIVSIAGAFILTLYKGPQILTTSSSKSNYEYLNMQQSDWVIGGLLLTLDCVASAAFIIVQGVLGSTFQVGVITWCLHKTGPLFVAMFHPVGIVIAAVLGIIFLQEVFYVGSLMGSVVIVFGFYSVMWGKAKEANKVKVIPRPIDSIGEDTSLLRTRSDDAEA